jgi:transposase
MNRSRRKFDAEFKRQAVQMVLSDHKSCRSVEQNLGIGQGIVYRWVREAKADPQHCFPGNGKIKPSEADVHNLLKENEHLRRERDILKKALGIFSRMPSRSTGSSPIMQAR